MDTCVRYIDQGIYADNLSDAKPLAFGWGVRKFVSTEYAAGKMRKYEEIAQKTCGRVYAGRDTGQGSDRLEEVESSKYFESNLQPPSLIPSPESAEVRLSCQQFSKRVWVATLYVVETHQGNRCKAPPHVSSTITLLTGIHFLFRIFRRYERKPENETVIQTVSGLSVVYVPLRDSCGSGTRLSPNVGPFYSSYRLRSYWAECY